MGDKGVMEKRLWFSKSLFFRTVMNSVNWDPKNANL
jgi:hypothetical protein